MAAWEFDPAKDAANIAKHGISLSRAAEMDLQEAVDDERYSELRKRAYALLDGRPYCLAYVVRGETRRAVSLRRCHAEEFERYVARTDRGDQG